MQIPAGRRWTRSAPILVLCALSAALYGSAGAWHAYLAEDDFTWLLGGLTFTWSQFDVAARSHFFRPVINLWFDSITRPCGTSAGCYHVANLAVHTANVALVFVMTRALSRRPRVAVLATLLFVVLPAYAQTVVWVSAITGLMATLWFLVSLLLQLDALGRDGGQALRRWLAVGAFALAVFSHEATATLPLVSVLLHRWFSASRRMPRTLVAGFAAVLALFAVTTVIANRNNYVFTEHHYAIGLHMIRSAFDYVAALYVGPHTLPAYALSLAAMAALFLCDRVTRFGAAWLLITLIPFLGFTWGNAGRYLYLPSIGFALALAGALSFVADWLARRWTSRAVDVALTIVTLAIAIRFGAFERRAIRSQVAWMAATQAYVEQVQALRPQDGRSAVTVPAPTSPLVDPMYVEPMLRWAWQEPGLSVSVTPTRILR